LSKNYFNSTFTANKIDFPFKKGPEFTLKDDLHINFISVNDHNDLMISYVGTLGSSWGSKLMTESGFFLNNGLNLFSYGQNNIKSGNTIDRNKQPRALMTPILTYNKKNPCISRFLISYSHHDHMENMDFALSGKYFKNN
jgi:gamma-glutamyltranspeptidase